MEGKERRETRRTKILDLKEKLSLPFTFNWVTMYSLVDFPLKDTLCIFLSLLKIPYILLSLGISVLDTFG